MTDRIAIVIESLGGGGAQHVAATLANAWAAAGKAVTVVTLQGPERDFFKLDERIERCVIGGARASPNVVAAAFANIRRVIDLRNALRRSAATIVLSFVGSTNVLTILAARRLGARIVVAERNDPQRQSLGPIWDRLRRRLYRFADLVIVNSRGVIDAMAAYVPRQRMIWLPNPLRAPLPGKPPGDPPAAVVFLAVGRLHAQKAYDVLLAALAEVVRERPDSRLAILGAGPLRDALERQASQLDLARSVEFVGQVDDPFPWYGAAQVLVHPARFEGMPNAVLEAMSQGLPVIVSDAQTGLADIVRHGETGLVVPVGSVHELARAMMDLARDAEQRRRLGAAGRDAVAPFQSERAIAAWSQALFGEP